MPFYSKEMTINNKQKKHKATYQLDMWNFLPFIRTVSKIGKCPQVYRQQTAVRSQDSSWVTGSFKEFRFYKHKNIHGKVDAFYKKTRQPPPLFLLLSIYFIRVERKCQRENSKKIIQGNFHCAPKCSISHFYKNLLHRISLKSQCIFLF